MDISTAKRAAIEGLPVTVYRPGTEPIRYSRISAIIFTPVNGIFKTSLELADMVKGVTRASTEYVELTEEEI